MSDLFRSIGKSSRSGSSRSSASSRTRTIFVSYQAALLKLSLDSRADSENVGDYAAEALHQFVKEWAESNELSLQDVPDRVHYAVDEEILTNVGKSVAETELRAIANGIEAILGHVIRGRTTATVDTRVVMEPRKPWGIEVTIDDAFLSAYHEVVEGFGFPIEEEHAKLKDVNANMILSFVSMAPEVYGIRSVARHIDSAFDRFEPNTGSYRELSAVADKAAGLTRKGSRR